MKPCLLNILRSLSLWSTALEKLVVTYVVPFLLWNLNVNYVFTRACHWFIT
jgi:hypothetical protein